MNLQDHSRVRTDDSRIIICGRFVCGTDFAQFRSGGFDDLTDPKAAADLHQFAPRNNDVSFSPSEMSNN